MDKQQRIAVFLKGSDAGMVIQNYQENPDLFPAPTAEELAAFDEWQKQQSENQRDQRTNVVTQKIENSLMLYLVMELKNNKDGIKSYDFYKFLTKTFGMDFVTTAFFNSILYSMKRTGLINIGQQYSMIYLTPQAAMDWAGIEKQIPGGVK